MGIGNLNNNFGSLTAGNVLKNNTAKNNGKAETLNTNVKANVDSLNTATLDDKDGKIFDSNNLKDNTEVLYGKSSSKSKKTFKDCWNKALSNRQKNQGHTVTSGSNPKDGSALMLLGASFVDAVIDYFGW